MTIYVCPFAFEERINNVSAMVWTATWDPMRSHENEEIQHDGKGSIWPRDAGHTMIRLGFSAPGSYLKDLILWSSGVKWIHWSSAIRKMTWIGDRTLQIIHTKKKTSTNTWFEPTHPTLWALHYVSLAAEEQGPTSYDVMMQMSSLNHHIIFQPSLTCGSPSLVCRLWCFKGKQPFPKPSSFM